MPEINCRVPGMASAPACSKYLRKALPLHAGAAFVRQLQGDFIADYSIWPLIKPRVLRIVPRPVYCVWE